MSASRPKSDTAAMAKPTGASSGSICSKLIFEALTSTNASSSPSAAGRQKGSRAVGQICARRELSWNLLVLGTPKSFGALWSATALSRVTRLARWPPTQRRHRLSHEVPVPATREHSIRTPAAAQTALRGRLGIGPRRKTAGLFRLASCHPRRAGGAASNRPSQYAMNPESPKQHHERQQTDGARRVAHRVPADRERGRPHVDDQHRLALVEAAAEQPVVDVAACRPPGSAGRAAAAG